MRVIFSLKTATVVCITQKEEQCHCELFQAKYLPSLCTVFYIYYKALHKQAGSKDYHKLEELTGGCELLRSMCGRQHVLWLLLTPGTQPPKLALLFYSSPFLYFLFPTFFLLITRNSIKRQFPSLLVYICFRLGQATLSSALTR